MTLHYVRRRPAAARRSLIKATRDGSATLVLGAGVSMSRGVPSWKGLVTSLWSELDPPRAMPPWLDSGDAPPHPLAFQILLEEIEGATRAALAREKKVSADDVDPLEVEQRLAGDISKHLYANQAATDPSDTMGVLIDLLRREQRSSCSRIARVISFNADDLLERGANDGHDLQNPVVFPVPRGSFHPRHDPCAHGRPPINIFHLHGFIPRSRNYLRSSLDSLVFTDAQYWASIANPSSFANRVMGNALQVSHCIFIGLSMTDVNLMRWLGLRHTEFYEDRASHYAFGGKSRAHAAKKAREAINRHYWICTEQDDPSRFIASHLERRGVTTVALPSWGEAFKTLIDECFGCPQAETRATV